jgi:hypothetical protein
MDGSRRQNIFAIAYEELGWPISFVLLVFDAFAWALMFPGSTAWITTNVFDEWPQMSTATYFAAAVFLLALWLSIGLAMRVRRLEGAIAPSLSLQFEPARPGFLRHSTLKDGSTGADIPYGHTFLRAKLSNGSATNVVNDVELKIEDVKRVSPQDGGHVDFADPLPVKKSLTVATTRFDLKPLDSTFVDVLYFDGGTKKLSFLGDWPLSLRDMFAIPGMYEVRVLATSLNGGASRCTFRFHWDGPDKGVRVAA